MTDAQLKPCPFCGSANLKSGGDDKFVGVWCLNCGCIGPNHYDCRFDWNTRADLTPSVKPLEWQPIETAPKDGTPILLYSENGAKNWLKSSRGMAVDRWRDRFHFWGKFNKQYWPPTHWMPLPDGPSDHPAPSDKDAEIERLREALTPSGSTKAAYIGEFTFSVRRLDEDGDEYSEMIDVPWTTIKEIMVAIAARAALEERG